MKPKSIRRQASTLALVTALTTGFTSAAQYTWLGTTDTTWATSSNWNASGVAQTNGTFVHRLNANNTGVNISKPATYNFPGITTTYATNSASGNRGLVIGSNTNGSLIISGGTFSTLGAVGGDIIGNVTGNSGTLTIDGSANNGDAHFVSTSVGISLGLGFGTTATFNIKNGSATLFDLTTNNTTATINLEAGGTLTMNRLNYSGGGNNIINFNGGTLKSRTASATFITTPGNGNTIINVKAAGAIIDAGHNITIARPLLEDATSLGGGITKNGTATLTLGGVSTTTGPAIVNAGGLGVPAGPTSWTPSSLTHSGNIMNFSVGIYNPSNLAAIDTAGAVSFSSPTTVNVSGSQFTIGRVPLIKYGSLSGFSNLTLNTASLPVGVVATLENDGAGLIFLNVTQGGFVWSGAEATPGTGDWDTTSSNWNNFLGLYASLAPVTFPTISGGGTVTIPADVSPAAVDFTNTSGNDYFIDGIGKITGSAVVNKTASGRVTLTNTNTYTGNTNISAGILSISSTGALPGWNVNSRYPIASGATLAVQNTIVDASIAAMLATTGNFGTGAILGFDTEAADRTYAPNLVGTIGVANVGSNVLTLSGTNSYTGNTLVTAGTLKAGSSTAFTGTGPLLISGTAAFDLGGFDASFTTVNAATISNTITSEATGAGTSTLTFTSGGASFTGSITDGSTRKIAVRCRATNASNVPNNSDNTFSGGLVLLGGLDAATNGTRLLPFSTFTNVDPDTGLITSGPYGRGPISIGETATDKVQIYLNAPGRVIANDIIVNTTAGTDTTGSFRVESSGNILSGAILANAATAFFRNNVTGGSAGTGEITLTGPISTGSNPAAGLTATAAGFNPLTLTLNNQTALANSYSGDTTISGINSTLVLGAANQIPNGAGKGNVAMVASKLNLAGFNETINGLSGSGTVDNLTFGEDNTLTLGDGDATGFTFSGVITNTNNTLTLVKTGTGTQTLSGPNSYLGTTTIHGGTLLINGDQGGATNAVQVNAATLGGTGTLGGEVTITSQGTIAPGAVGTIESLDITANTSIAGTLAYDIDDASTDSLSVTGNLTLTGSTLAINEITPAAPGSHIIASYTGTRIGTFGGTLPAGYTLNYDDISQTIELVVPAPAGYTSWATTNNVTESETGDDDKDGISNLAEYALGLDPKLSNPAPGTFVGNLLTFTKGTEANAADDVTYAIETSTSLQADSWTSAVVATPEESTISLQLPANQLGGKLFARLKITRL